MLIEEPNKSATLHVYRVIVDSHCSTLCYAQSKAIRHLTGLEDSSGNVIWDIQSPREIALALLIGRLRAGSELLNKVRRQHGVLSGGGAEGYLRTKDSNNLRLLSSPAVGHSHTLSEL